MPGEGDLLAAADRVRAYDASEAVGYHSADWPAQALRAATGRFSVGINAVRGEAAALLPSVADGGRIRDHHEQSQSQRGIQVMNADGPALEAAVDLVIARG